MRSLVSIEQQSPRRPCDTIPTPSVKRQIGYIVRMVTLGNGSGVDLERQVKRHHKLALVTLPLPLPLDAPLDAQCGYALKRVKFKMHFTIFFGNVV